MQVEQHEHGITTVEQFKQHVNNIGTPSTTFEQHLNNIQATFEYQLSKIGTACQQQVVII